MVYIYCKRGSESARALADAIQGKRLRTFDGMTFFRGGKKVKLAEGDCIVAWGEPVPDLQGIRVLNGAILPNKYKVAVKLSEAGIPTIQVRLSRPSSKEWFGRSNFHVGGNDLLTPTTAPDFWVKREDIVEEYRIHSFLGKSIRAGKKIVREGYSLDQAAVDASNGTLKLASSWIRSFDGGWRICYDNFQSKKAMREIAHKAVEALGLDFGAVDIAKCANGNLIVLEVNRAPGLEGGSVEQYAKHVKGWVNNEIIGDETPSVAGGESVQPSNGQAIPNGTGGATPTAQPAVQASEPAAAPAPTASAPISPATTYAFQHDGSRWQRIAVVGPVAPAEQPVEQPVPNEQAASANDLWQYLSQRVATEQRSPLPRTGFARVPEVQGIGNASARQGIQAVGNGGAPAAGDGPLSTSRLSDLQRRRISWSRWNNKYTRITDINTKRRVLAEAVVETRRGKLPFDPDTIPAQ